VVGEARCKDEPNCYRLFAFFGSVFVFRMLGYGLVVGCAGSAKVEPGEIAVKVAVTPGKG
jgi:hypothetical protein